MKCAVACMRSSRVRRDFFAIRSSYHPGVFESKNDTRQAALVLARTRASVQETQNGVGWWIGVCRVDFHSPPGTLSQRRLPMITAAAPFSILYVRRSGAT